MREDDDFGHYVPILRRIIILVAVITAVPVVLWTITAFVRAYVVPVKVPTFHQLASTASINTSANSTSPKPGDRPAAAAEQTKSSDPQPTLTGQKPALADAGDSPATPKGTVTGRSRSRRSCSTISRRRRAVGCHENGGPIHCRAGHTAMARAPSTTGALPVPGVSGGAAPNPAVALAAQQPPPSAGEPAAETLTPAAPLTGLVPLPRQRPRDAGSVRIADMAPSSIPVPRPRPDAAGPAAPAIELSRISFIRAAIASNCIGRRSNISVSMVLSKNRRPLFRIMF